MLDYVISSDVTAVHTDAAVQTRDPDALPQHGLFCVWISTVAVTQHRYFGPRSYWT